MHKNAQQVNFDETLGALLQTKVTRGRSGTMHEATGLSSVNNIHAIRNCIMQQKPRRTLEIGMAFGASSLAVLRSLHDCHADGNFHHTAIDPYQKDYDYAGVELLKTANLSHNFTLHEETSDTILPELLKAGRKYDFVYVDGSHLFEHVFIDMFFCLKLLTLGGVAFFDDCADKHVKKVLAFVASNFDKHLKEMPTCDFQPTKSFLRKWANKAGYGQLRAFVKGAELPRVWNAPLGAF